jgi:ABC-type multidrug transport system fused ATPase/permease subunit
MAVLWKYLRPQRGQVMLVLLLAATAQVLALYDPIILGQIIDRYATPPFIQSADERVKGALGLLALAVALAIGSRLARTLQEYVTNLVVQRFGVAIFNDGLKQTMRLSYQEYAEQTSGVTLSILQRVRRDTERFISAFINVLFSTLVGIGFLSWYAVTKHWILVPVFLIGMLVLGGDDLGLERSHQNHATSHQSGFQPTVRGDHGVAAQHRTDQESGPDLPRGEASARAHRGDFRSGDGQGREGAHPLFPAGRLPELTQAVDSVRLALADLP